MMYDVYIWTLHHAAEFKRAFDLRAAFATDNQSCSRFDFPLVLRGKDHRSNEYADASQTSV